MNTELVIDMAHDMLRLCVVLGGPLLAAALVAGLLSSALQAATNVHEQTLSFLPKLVAVTLVMLASLPWLLARLVEYSSRLISTIPQRL